MEGPDIIGDPRVTGAQRLQINFLSVFAFKTSFYGFCLYQEKGTIQMLYNKWWKNTGDVCTRQVFGSLYFRSTFPKQIETILKGLSL